MHGSSASVGTLSLILAPIQSAKHWNYNAAFFLTSQGAGRLPLHASLLLTACDPISESNPEWALRLQVAYL